MDMVRTSLFGIVFFAAIFGAGASTAQIVVTPGDAQGWTGRASNTGTLGVGIADQQGGTGSLSMVTTGSGGDIVKVARIPLITIDAITSISWDVYTDNAAAYPRPQLEYYELGGRAGTLTYVNTNASVPLNTWTSLTVDINNDLFQSSEAGASPPQSLSAWQAELPGVLMNFFQLGYGSTGAAATTTNANIDFVELNGSIWDFEDGVPPVEPPPTPEFLTVDPTNLQGWFDRVSTGAGSLSTNEPRGPGGTGSLEMITDGSAGQIVNVARIPLTTVDAITGVSWEFNSNGAGGNQLPVAKIEYFSFSRSGTLVYTDPVGYTPGTWQAEDGLTGNWWSTELGFGDQRTLSEWQVELAGVPVNFFSVGMGSTGGAFPATTAYVDTVRFASSREDITWDFEGTAVLPPEPALTTTTITSSAPNPSDVGESVTISYTVAVVAPGVGTPTGTVTVSDGVTRAVLCSATAAAGSCATSFAVPGDVGLVASFVSDVTDYADSISNTAVHTVADAATGPTPPPGGSAPVPTPLPPWMLAMLSLLLVTVVYKSRRYLS